MGGNGRDIGSGDRASGLVVVDSSVKKVQHPTGGVVGEIDGHGRPAGQGRRSAVAAGRDRDAANLQMVTRQLDELAVRSGPAARGAGRTARRLSGRKSSRAQTSRSSPRSWPRKTSFVRSRRSAPSKVSRRSSRADRAACGGDRRARRAAARGATRSSSPRPNSAGSTQLEGKNLISTPRITAARRHGGAARGRAWRRSGPDRADEGQDRRDRAADPATRPGH